MTKTHLKTQEHSFRFLTRSIFPLLAVGGFANIAYSQTTRTWDGGGVPTTNMDIAANWSGDTVPNGTDPGDIAQWDGTVAGDLSLTYTAAGTGANLAAGNGISLNIPARWRSTDSVEPRSCAFGISPSPAARAL